MIHGEIGESNNLFAKRYITNATREQYDAVVQVLISNSGHLRGYINDLWQFNGREIVQKDLSEFCTMGMSGGVTVEITDAGNDRVKIIVYTSNTPRSEKRIETTITFTIYNDRVSDPSSEIQRVRNTLLPGGNSIPVSRGDGLGAKDISEVPIRKTWVLVVDKAEPRTVTLHRNDWSCKYFIEFEGPATQEEYDAVLKCLGMNQNVISMRITDLLQFNRAIVIGHTTEQERTLLKTSRVNYTGADLLEVCESVTSGCRTATIVQGEKQNKLKIVVCHENRPTDTRTVVFQKSDRNGTFYGGHTTIAEPTWDSHEKLNDGGVDLTDNTLAHMRSLLES